jgi:PAS domain S-box-containing protein
VNLHNPLKGSTSTTWHVLRVLPLTPLALAVLVAGACTYAVRERVQVQAQAQQQAALYARILADHTARSVSAVKLLMGAAGSRVGNMMGEAQVDLLTSAEGVHRTLSDVTAGQPILRSLSLVSGDGVVKASSQTLNVGSRLDPRVLEAAGGWEALSVNVATGRDLADASLGLRVGSKHQTLLLAQGLPVRAGQPPLWLVAALNPEFFALQHQLMLDSPHWRAAVLTLDGKVLTATENFPSEPGSALVGAPGAGSGEFGLWLRQHKSDSDAIGAWRLTRSFPLRVHVELPEHEVLASWRADMRSLALGTLVVGVGILGLGATVRRHRRDRHEAEADRTRAREQLREQYEMTEQLVDAMAVPVFLTDLGSNLLLANRAWVTLLSLDKNPSTAAATAERDARVEALLNRGIADVNSESSTQWSLDLPEEDGSLRETVVTKVALRSDSGQVRGVIGTIVDVTEYKQAARATESARRAAEASNQARADFVANITHELRTPLQSILGFAELGQDRAGGQDKLKLMFQRVHESGTRMLRLVEELLDMSRIGSTVGSISLRDASLAEPLRDVVDELRPLARKRDLTLKLQVDEELRDALCSIDPTRVQQVARNVIANALRFAPQGTDVDVSLRLHDDMAWVSVRDHGPGIPPAETEAIFEPFVQSSLTKDGSGGTGLGLAICRQILKAHGGSIEAGNHEQGGAVFRFGVQLSQPVAGSRTSGADASRGLQVQA